LFEGLQSLLGGQGGASGQGGQEQRRDYQDFVGRYEQGAPWEGISDREASQRYDQVASRLSPQEYQESAQEAFARLTPQQRQQFGQYLQQQARQQGVDVPDLNRDGIDDRMQDPAYLAQVTGRLQQQQPGLVGQLLGAGGGAGAGGGGVGQVLANPLAKAALAGIAAIAVKRMMDGNR
jgi:hypothetical protein